jgi:hypothetical protein
MKKGLTLILLLIILLQSSMKSIYVAYYHINQEYISSVLCINKDKPTSSCNGKCYLKKKMVEQEKQQQSIPSVLKGLDEVLLYCVSYNWDFTTVYAEEAFLASLDAYEMPVYKTPTDFIIQPPQ